MVDPLTSTVCQRRRFGLSIRQPVADRVSLRPLVFRQLPRNPVTIAGADGRTVSGRAILDFSDTYPSVFDSSVTRRLLSGDTVPSELGVRPAGGVRVEHEHGSSERLRRPAQQPGGFVEARGAVRRYLYVNGGLDSTTTTFSASRDSTRFGRGAPPAASSTAGFGDTKLTFNAGKASRNRASARNCRRSTR